MTMNFTPTQCSAFGCFRDEINSIVASVNLDSSFNIEDFWQAIDRIETQLQLRYVRMDFGVPGLLPPDICLNEHVTALEAGTVAQAYPPYAGAVDLRKEVATFVAQRTDVNLDPDHYFVTCGGTQALYVAQAVAASLQPARKSVLFLAPVYPPVLAQARMLGLTPVCLDTTELRGRRLLQAIEASLHQHRPTALCWASPSNPTWTVLDHEELSGLAALCETYSVLPIEDMTYLGMVGNRHGMIHHTPSIGLFTQRHLMVLSSSKMLSYAGERMGFLAGSDALLQQNSPSLVPTFGTDNVGRACASMIFNTTAGAPHSCQHGVAGILRAINSGQFDLKQHLFPYIQRAAHLKQILRDSGFILLNQGSDNQELDGFYVCFCYPGLSGTELATKLLHCGISVLPLTAFGAEHTDGVRACVSRLDDDKLAWASERLGQFSGR